MDQPDPREDLAAGIEAMRKKYDQELASEGREYLLEEMVQWIRLAADMLRVGMPEAAP